MSEDKKKKYIFRFLDSNFGGYKININDDSYTKIVDLLDEDDNPIFSYYYDGINVNYYRFKGTYPMMYFENYKNIMEHYIGFFTEQSIPYIFQWFNDRYNINLPEVKTYLVGSTDLLDRKLKPGIWVKL